MTETEKQRKSNIFQGVKHHLNELKRLRPEYEFVMIAAQGSQNYNLDMYTDEYMSDIDTVAMVLPSFESFVNNNKMISETIVLDNNEHIDVKDIRLLVDLFKKQNIKYLEILHTDFRIINPKYKTIVKSMLLDNANLISNYDVDKLVTCAYGMSLEKLKALEHPYEGLKEKIEKYGYDGKQLHHIVRLFLFTREFINNNYDFKRAMDSNNYTNMEVELLQKSKLSVFSLDMARMLANEAIEHTTNLRNEFINSSNIRFDAREEIDNVFEELLNSLFREYFKIMFTPNIPESKKSSLLPTADKIFVTSDLHFGHNNILNFESGRWDLVGKTQAEAIKDVMINEGLTPEEIYNVPDDVWEKCKSKANEECIELHDEELIRRWNETVKNDNDIVFILGDLSFRRGKETNEILKRLNGKKVLVTGNHDHIFMDKNLDKSLFLDIVDYKEITIDNRKIVMFHFPIQSWNQQHYGSIHLYGHIHSNSHPLYSDLKNSYNVGVDVNDYRPVCLKTYLERL